MLVVTILVTSLAPLHSDCPVKKRLLSPERRPALYARVTLTSRHFMHSRERPRA